MEERVFRVVTVIQRTGVIFDLIITYYIRHLLPTFRACLNFERIYN